MEHHHKHIHTGRPSSRFFNPNQVLNYLDIKEGVTILDAGCGNGSISIVASKLVGESGEIFAVDIDTNLIDMLKKEIERNKIKNIKVEQADISKKIPIEDNKIDICFMVNVFHGLVENDEIENSLREIKRVVKDGGAFEIVEFKKVDSYPGPPKSIRLSPDQIESLLNRYDFKKQDLFDIGSYHYGMIFRNL
jgi:FkbM family methyltransferase